MKLCVDWLVCVCDFSYWVLLFFVFNKELFAFAVTVDRGELMFGGCGGRSLRLCYCDEDPAGLAWG